MKYATSDIEAAKKGPAFSELEMMVQHGWPMVFNLGTIVRSLLGPEACQEYKREEAKHPAMGNRKHITSGSSFYLAVGLVLLEYLDGDD